MIDCLLEGNRLRKEHYHALELPGAQLAALQANMNRDPKKQRKPYSVEDFCFFVDHEANKPEVRAASAYMRLLKDNLIPPWAVFCFQDFKHATASSRPSSEVAMVGESFILLDPQEIDGGFVGLMLAEHTAASKVITVDYDGQHWQIQTPEFEDFVLAKAGTEVDLVRPFDAQPDD